MKRKTVSGIMLTLLMASILIVLTSPIPVIAQTDSTTAVYLDPPTINGTAIGVGNTVTVNLMIRDAPNLNGWAAGMIFNATLLNCTGFEQGEFLSNVGSTLWQRAPINNTSGEIGLHACIITVPGTYAHDDGRLAYLTFKVKAPGLSDLHLRDVEAVSDLTDVPINIIDVYTAVVDTTAHTVVTVSNSTGKTGLYGSGFYAHAFSLPDKEISFNVTGPHPGFSNVTIPKVLLNVSALDEWKVIIDNRWLDIEERTVTENTTHTSICFKYTLGIHKVQITTGPPLPPYTLTIYSSPTGVTFTVDGVSRATPWSGTYSQGSLVSLIMPEIHTVGDARYYWNQWSDGITSRSRTVTMNTDITLTAYYAGPYYQLTVTSSPMIGIQFTINGAPKTTPYTEWLLEGSYTLIMPETHNGYVWSHWLEDGDTNRIKTITLQGTTWTAVYEPAPPPVGGKATPISIPMNKPETPTLWIWLTTIILSMVITVVYVKKRKRQ